MTVDRTHVSGIVRDFQQRRERSLSNTDVEMELWYFRVERHDANGNRLAPVPVEMKGLTFSGSVSNGDEVRVHGRWHDGTLRAEELTNLTTSARVQAKSYRRLRLVVSIVGVVFVVIILVFIISTVISMSSAPWPPEY